MKTQRKARNAKLLAPKRHSLKQLKISKITRITQLSFFKMICAVLEVSLTTKGKYYYVSKTNVQRVQNDNSREEYSQSRITGLLVKYTTTRINRRLNSH